MKFVLVILALVSVGLTYEASTDSRMTQRLFFRHHDRGLSGPEWLAVARAGVEIGNPYWQMTYGLVLMEGDGDNRVAGPDIPADPERGRALVDAAAEQGLTQGLFTLWWMTGRVDDGLLARAVELGDPTAVESRLRALLENIECTPEGLAAFEADRPSLDAVRTNRERSHTLREQWELPPGWGGFWDRDNEALYHRLERTMALDLPGIRCATNGTPVVAGQ